MTSRKEERMTDYVNEIEFKRAICALKDEGEIFEIRILQGGGKRKDSISGFFRDAETACQAMKTVRLHNSNVYITLNQPQEECYSWFQHDKFVNGMKSTEDANITRIEWLFVDLDPVRLSDISSSDEEMGEAYKLLKQVYSYMRNLGFEEPLQGMSGNGFHLLYRVDIENTPENVDLIHDCLTVLAELFSNDRVKIDEVNYNPARICKLYGTLAQKGANTEDRPHRMSKVLSKRTEYKPTARAYLEKLTREIEIEKPNTVQTISRGVFDLKEFMAMHNLEYEEEQGRDCTIYRLEHCPFNAHHEHGDSKIFSYSNGAIAFKCHHNSCRNYKWQDVRQLLDPGCYDSADDPNEKRIEEGWKQHNAQKTEGVFYEHIENPQQKFLTPEMIFALNEPEQEFIKSGCPIIDKKKKGLAKGEVTVLSGLRGAAKSTWLTGLMLQAIEDGHTVISYSGELSKKQYINWLCMQAAGKGFTKQYEKWDGYYCPDDVKSKVVRWIDTKCWIYDNNCGNDFAAIAVDLRQAVKDHKADMVLIDNIMALDLSALNYDKYEAQTKFVWDLKDMAQTCNVHVIFVAHPRKAVGFLRLDDISGTGNIGNIVDNAFIIHRKNNDFCKKTEEMFGWKKGHEAYSGDSCVEICKDRAEGLQDVFIPLWFEQETKRLKYSEDENKLYSWRDHDKAGTKAESEWTHIDEREVPF